MPLALIPVQYRLAAKLAAVLVVALLLFSAGWKINGWRLGTDIAQLESQLETARANNAELTEALNDQGKKVREMERESMDRQAAATAALQAAQGRVSTLEGQIKDLRNARGETAEDAENLINEALGL